MGLLGPYAGIDPDGSPVTSQLGQLRDLIGDREIDVLHLSIGANDVGFGRIAKFCAFKDGCLFRNLADSREDFLHVPYESGLPAHRGGHDAAAVAPAGLH